jgi:hypothetical protein
LEAFTANMIEPTFSPLIAIPKAWTPSTPKTIRGEPVLLDVNTQADFEKYRGKLLRAIVLLAPPREVKPLFDPPATRRTDENLLALANADPSARRPRRPSGPGPDSQGSNAQGGGQPQPPAGNDANRSGQPPAFDPTGRMSPEARSAMQLQFDKWQFAYDEGAAVILEPGRGDGGTVFVGGATLPRRPDAGGPRGGDGAGERPTGRIQAWSPEAKDVLPQVVLAVEHYNRIARMIQRGAHPILEIDIGSRFHSDELDSFNILAELPGTDLKDEIVMLGAHFDSWHAGTGATDNAVGCAVAMEAIRILKAIDAKPRRTIRLGLWTGEEQGLYGSRAYVTKHFGKMVTPSRESTPSGSAPNATAAGDSAARPSAGSERASRGDRPPLRYEVTPNYEKLSAYFNLDNGAGKIRGIYLQGNENVRSIFRTWLRPFADQGASTVTVSNTGGTDHLSFDSIGLPGFQFIQDPLEYDTRTHHSSMDVFERLQADDAKQASVIMATFAYHTAMRDQKLPRKPVEGVVVPVETAKTTEAAAATGP